MEKNFLFKIKKIMDYPFTDWENYFRAFGCSLSNEEYHIEYPKYDENVCDFADVSIVSELLKIQDKQIGFDLFIKTVLNNYKYVYIQVEDIHEIIDLFIGVGAVLPDLDVLFELKYPFEPGNSDKNEHNLEKECYGVDSSRSVLIKGLLKHYPEINTVLNSYPANNFDDITDDKRKFIVNNESDKYYKEAIFEHLKDLVRQI
jgi:hypothetical protein